jgi:MFS family permease
MESSPPATLERSSGAGLLRFGAPTAALIFSQMLPATLVGPAIRPFFARFHGGNESAMHAFMSVNMVGAVVAAPLIGRLGDARGATRRLVAALAVIDALLLFSVTMQLPITAVLTLRTLEGAAHVGAATLLMAEAAASARRAGDGRMMGLAGSALMIAVALGSAFGGALAGLDPRLPFWCGAALLMTVGVVTALGPPGVKATPAQGHPAALSVLRARPALWLPMSAAFIGRFTIGCLVVTFSLFAHRQHGLSDRAVGALYTMLTLPFALLTYPAGRLSARVPRAALLGIGTLVYAAGLFLLGRAPSGGLPILMLLLGVASAAIYAPTLCYTATMAEPAERARAVSLVNATSCLGMVIGPMVAGITCAIVTRGAPPQIASLASIDAYRTVFAIASISALAWLALATPALVRRYRLERGRTSTH